jgi:hypothetical protein
MVKYSKIEKIDGRKKFLLFFVSFFRKGDVMEHYIKIPMVVVTDKELSSSAKCLYGYIDLFSIKKGYCYASNEYISNCFGLSKRSITRLIKLLIDKDYIRIEYTKEHFRKIYTNMNINNKDYVEIFDYDWLNDDDVY